MGQPRTMKFVVFSALQFTVDCDTIAREWTITMVTVNNKR